MAYVNIDAIRIFLQCLINKYTLLNHQRMVSCIAEIKSNNELVHVHIHLPLLLYSIHLHARPPTI